jgi:hypothetical protein
MTAFLLGAMLAACSSDDSSSNHGNPDGGSGGSGTGGSGGGTGGGSSGTGGSAENTLSTQYPGDLGLANDPRVILFDDFEAGWGRWDQPTADTTYLHLETIAAEAHAGAGYLRSTVTFDHLAAEQNIGAKTVGTFSQKVDTVYWRFHVRFPHIAPNPHHWVRMEAGDDAWSASGLANTVPPGDQGFWFDFDIDNDDVFNFYVYWHEMRSGRCNDGTAVPGCEGDQGTTYYYGNVFRPKTQTPFARNEWFCVEGRAVANTVGQNDGSLTFWIDEKLVGDYGPGYPIGTWLRATFHEGGCSFSACTPPVPFEGFDFRTEADVKFKRFFLDAYYQLDTATEKKAELEAKGLTVSEEQTILYDDVVVATERIGCQKPAP